MLTRCEPHRRPLASVLITASTAVLAFAGGHALLEVFGASGRLPGDTARDAIAAAFAVACATGFGLVQAHVARGARRAERDRVAAQSLAMDLVAELQEEELRLRYELAETVHGSVQGAFVVIEARLRHLATTGGGTSDASAELLAIAGQLERLRERELRTLSARLYPVDLERGLAPALRALVERLPSSVAVRERAGTVLTDVEAHLTHEGRVLVIRVIEEALSNALRHGNALHIEVSARREAEGVVVIVSNDGEPPSPHAALSGLARLRRRAIALGGDVVLASGEGGAGARLTLVLALRAVS